MGGGGGGEGGIVVWDDTWGMGMMYKFFFQNQFCNSLYYLKFKTKNEIDEV